MAKFSEQFIQQVAQATDIVELISQYVSLKKRGKEFVGLCPFHEDHRPSLYISPAKQIFKCFACGAGGGVYQFLMLYEKLPFPEAVRTLAERAHIPLPQTTQATQAEEGFSKNDLVVVTTFAARFFRSTLRSAEGKAALDYALGRGLTEKSIDRFGLGFAPDSWDALLRAAGRERIDRTLLIAAGLASKREDGSGCYDRFRNRLVFPIFDLQGRVVAFGGRAMTEDERAKYLNSPETILFDKSSLLYGLNWSREAIVSAGQAVVVEGYLDALIPLQAGLNNVVATLGTALTDRHVQLLSRYVKEAVLIFDADTAGQAAVERALEIFLAQRLHVRVVTVPAGNDPCDYCLAEGHEALQRLIDAAPDALQYVWEKRREAWQAAGGNLADRHRLVEEFLNFVVSSAAYGVIDEVRRGQLAQHIAHLLNVPAADLQQQMRRLARRIARSSQARGEPAQQQYVPSHAALAERQLLEVLLNRPELFDQAAEKLAPEDFTNEQYRRVAERVWLAGSAGRLNLEELLASEELAELAALLADMATAGERRANYEPTLRGAAEHMLYRRRQRRTEELKTSGEGEEALRELLERLKSPDVRRHPKIR